ncbi:ribosome small subunit-dependent GTPase A [Anaerobacillus alkaliphilus]|uniref:Small ribosomal subunit biogenesis GTPase RsgA n=1 Tax=Anaerobacillus alkaliphilus TaxID=1548597 RepID=A0A4Q0VXR4_9BACI|nr:ribosome small subunit-dependent GTPase A [Anaerobacillus alkaliphilus]RXJ04339.1 ribosome small subunit-dependent GTPase A [Anaerobacillus alkaliphilus]
MNLTQLGWTEELEKQFNEYKSEGLTVGRIALEHKRIYRIFTEAGELLGEVSGKFRFQALGRESFPSVGDWVVISARPEEGKATIHAVLPRFSKFSRKLAGETTEEQIVAANVNTVFLVNALNNDFNLRRIERYLLMAWESGATPVIILSKADLCEDVEEKLAEVESVAFGVPTFIVSAHNGEGLEPLLNYLTPGQTVALLGSSGAGKSTLTNYLIGKEKQLVQEVREGDDRGKHTTTHRELVLLPNGGLIIDTPGMRELQLWEADDATEQVFHDIHELEEQCRFRDCTHGTEPGCAVKQAIKDGTLTQGRFDSYVKLQKELAYLARKDDIRAQLAEKAKWKKLTASSKKR